MSEPLLLLRRVRQRSGKRAAPGTPGTSGTPGTPGTPGTLGTSTVVTPTLGTPTPGTPTPATPTLVTLGTLTPATLTLGTPTLVTPTPATPTPATSTLATPTPVPSMTSTKVTLTLGTPTPGTPTPATSTPATLTPVTLTPATPTLGTRMLGTPTLATPTPATSTLATPTLVPSMTSTPGTPTPATLTPVTPGTPTPGTPTLATRTTPMLLTPTPVMPTPATSTLATPTPVPLTVATPATSMLVTPTPVTPVAPGASRRARGRRRRFYPEHRVYRARSSFLELSEEQVVRRYRLDKGAIAALCRELAADLESLTGRSHALPVAVKVTSALAFLAWGSFQAATRHATGISQSAMSKCLAQFLEALQRRAGRYIAFPGAAPRRGVPPAPLPGVLGLLGGMHVALRAPAGDERAYRNAGRFHSMNMQVVCDARGTITNVVAKFPGSCPNAAVLESSALARLLDGARPRGAWLLGDRSYPLKPWLMTPIARPRSAAEERYNALHHEALAALRRTRALLTRRFRCLDRAGGSLQYAPRKVCQIFLACCILHNIALSRRTPLDDAGDGDGDGDGDEAPDEAPARPPPARGSSEARAVRARIVRHVQGGLP